MASAAAASAVKRHVFPSDCGPFSGRHITATAAGDLLFYSLVRMLYPDLTVRRAHGRRGALRGAR